MKLFSHCFYDYFAESKYPYHKQGLMELIYKFGAYHGILLSMLLFFYRKYGKSLSNKVIALAILFFSICLLEWLSYANGFAKKYPHIIIASNPLLFSLAPLMLLYVESYAYKRIDFNLKTVLKLLPGILYLISALPFYSLSAEEKLAVFFSPSSPQLSDYVFGNQLWPYAYILLTIGYSVYAFYVLRKHSKSIAIKSRYKWLQRIVYGYLLFAFVGFLDWFVGYLFPELNYYKGYITISAQTILIHIIGYLAIINPNALLFIEKEEKKQKENGNKYTRSSLKEDTSNKIAKEIVSILENEQVYLDMDISPEYFSQKLDITKHQISQVLNQKMGVSFYDLINSYRISEAKRLIETEGDEKLKLIHIAFDSGFNNKTTFLRNFKKVTHMTPSQYRVAVTKEKI